MYVCANVYHPMYAYRSQVRPLDMYIYMRARLNRHVDLHGLDPMTFSTASLLCSIYRIIILYPSLRLVLASGGLASLELLKVPVADLHVAAVLVEALCEVLGGAGAVVVLLVLLGGGLGLDGSGGLGGAAREEAADCVADGRADGDTSSSAGHLAKQSRALRHLLGRHHALGSVLLRRSGHGGGRAVLLRGGSRSGRARRGAADGALTRHFCGCFGVVVRKDEDVGKARR